ncbi:MAG: hypothetical protein QXP52_01880 [Candidatus Aenigmatarchaeota archaeon]
MDTSKDLLTFLYKSDLNLSIKDRFNILDKIFKNFENQGKTKNIQENIQEICEKCENELLKTGIKSVCGIDIYRFLVSSAFAYWIYKNNNNKNIKNYLESLKEEDLRLYNLINETLKIYNEEKYLDLGKKIFEGVFYNDAEKVMDEIENIINSY